jgi:esterase/lipase
VTSTHRELLVLDNSGHVATVDYDASRLAHAVADFLSRFA